MKIPDRKTINVQLAENKRQQVSEGVRIAQKIDVLRGALESAQKNHKDFIENSQKEYERVTSQLHQKKKEIESQVTLLRKEREELKKPLDREWQQIEEARELLKEDEGLLSAKIEKIRSRDISLKEKEKFLKDSIARQDLLEKESEANNNRAKMANKQAENILHEAKNKAEASQKEIDARREEILLKEQEVEFNRLANEQVTRDNEIREQDMATRMRQLVDREQTLQRNLQRYGK